ncbi:type VI secretion system ImpA family N-terminal domain-containing protein (plasmid) [Rhizobium beringeri]|nr:type VI secretion system ImpA family N-terminal domain-containing protein [Rhizobium beringeri]WSG92209.1 type VI secretion system ImpA family N-terminal domain-containing protein [Rhizobium beringeri]
MRSNTVSREIYYRIKDARNAARTAERSIIPGETITIAPAWHDVSNLGLQILSSKSKDIEVLAWLAEAQLRLRGFSGLHDVYVATVSLLDKHFDALHSIGDGDVEERFAPFAGLNGVGGEGTLIQAIRLTSLIPGGKFAQFSLWDFQLSQRPNETERRKELQQAAAEAGVAQMSAYLGVLTGCIAAFDRMVEILDIHCGDQAPPSSNTRNVLQEAASAIRMLAGIEAPLAAPQALASQGSEPQQASETDEAEAIGLQPVSAEMILFAGRGLRTSDRRCALFPPHGAPFTDLHVDRNAGASRPYGLFRASCRAPAGTADAQRGADGSRHPARSRQGRLTARRSILN